jgi:L-ascorbate metabolism protein UlaG (beta-lactamase superfamily)
MEERMPTADEIHLPSPQAATPDFARGSVFFIGTATVLLRYAGFALLTDPNFLHAENLVYLGDGVISKRLTDPAINIEALPPIDFCILSHYHGDHFDRVAEEKLRKDLPIVTTQHAAKALDAKGFRVPIAIDTWNSVTLEKDGARVKITSMPGRHGPPVVEKLLPPVMGSLLEFQPAEGRTALRLYITGDTLLFDDLKEIPKKYPEIDLALFHLGGARIMGMLLTMDAEQGVEAIRMIQPRRVIPIHYNDYAVFKSPLEDFRKAVTDAGFQDRVTYLKQGDSYNFNVPEERIERAA